MKLNALSALVVKKIRANQRSIKNNNRMKTAIKTANILIVDDKQANIDIIEGLLTIEGYTNFKSITDSRKVVNLFE